MSTDIQIPMGNTDVEKMMFFESRNRTFGHLKGKALTKARRIVNKYGSISTSGEYGSIQISESDFIPVT